VTRARRVGLAAAPVLLAVTAFGCGKKGDPLPPLRREPGRIVDLTARRVDERIELRFTVPAANADGTRPPVIERVEIYRAARPSADPAPPPSQMLQPDLLRATYTIQTDEPAATPPPTPGAERRAAPGEVVTFIDGIDPADKPGTPEAPIWRYLAVGVHGSRRRGQPSNIVAVPLATVVPPGPQPTVTFDEQTLNLSWTPPSEPAAPQFQVYEVPSATATAVGKPLADKAIDKPALAMPVVFGAERCFVVRTIAVQDQTTIEGAPGPAACVTAVDKFPPAAPTGVVPVADQGTVRLVWRASEAKDLAGYVVLRGDGAGETLQPLFKEPIAETAYQDKSVTTGVAYTYAVIAVDRAGNQSAPSERQAVVVR
jgi:hypothetical protein